MSSAGYDFDSFKNASEWYSAAEKLAEVAAASSVKPVEAVSDEQGKVVYSDMEEGMYLVIGAAKSSVKAVSYTHLDVYKRQVRCHGVRKPGKKNFCEIQKREEHRKYEIGKK